MLVVNHEDDAAVAMRGRRVEEELVVGTTSAEEVTEKFPFGPVSDLPGRRELNMEQEHQLSAFFPLVRLTPTL